MPRANRRRGCLPALPGSCRVCQVPGSDSDKTPRFDIYIINCVIMTDNSTVYVLSAYVTEGAKCPSGLQHPQIFSSKAAANAAGRRLLAVISQQLGYDNVTDTHGTSKSGLYKGTNSNISE